MMTIQKREMGVPSRDFEFCEDLKMSLINCILNNNKNGVIELLQNENAESLNQYDNEV